jgi:hypothetical protein
VAIWCLLGDPTGLSCALSQLGHILTQQGDLDPAHALMLEALALRQSLGGERQIGWALFTPDARRL